ncbi:2-amino-4-oxopentanoate thiolase subunit OrtB [Fusibacter sp. 3D3]|uniref:2-amino-4-oxopentanoate thiolase subunit OrtB n=1 Tax=Fusibacter sp. 3D3 TaxID=1048380 RepID=UPI000855CCE1|nr:2-amino-4-oxopentanoate thiolase subunit OrtB [Fusibacter sp. 3D3]GAU79261.1 2-amino-4-ketopentanoate thiolase beta subunit [Fusibacter sp. 3D3]
MKSMSYEAVMSRKNEIMKTAVGIDYSKFEFGKIGFDYEGMMANVAYSMEEMEEIQRRTKVGKTPLFELYNINKLIKKYAEVGKGARIFIKDEAANASGSFKARRAAISVYHAKKKGYKGVIAATSGNYGAAVASQAAQLGLKCIIVQEMYDSRKIGQPEIVEKARKCEAFGAEVIRLTVGPELFYTFLKIIEETGYFNASLYTPFGIAGVETLGYEIAEQMLVLEGRYPDVVVATHAGGGNLTGTARGLIKAGATSCKIVGASVDLKGLHMASDKDFNRKSFTTGHTGFGIPFATQPDRADVPRNAARVLRYMDQYITVTQGDVFFATEALAQMEGIERGPAGNISLAAAIGLAKTLDKDQIIVVQETEYTGAGKHPSPQLTFAKQNGILVKRGLPAENIPGETVVIPEHLGQIEPTILDLNSLKKRYLQNALKDYAYNDLSSEDQNYLADEVKLSIDEVKSLIQK